MLTKIKIFENFAQNLDFPKIGTKNKIRNFPKFRKNIGIFENLDQTQDLLNFKFRPKLNFFLQISNKMAIYQKFRSKFRPKSRFSENFDQNCDF